MTIILIIQILVSVLLLTLVTLQSTSSSLSSSLTSSTQSGYHTKTGPEKLMYLVTIILAVIFIITSFVNLLTSF
jgi:protein translocase SecG subunit